VADKGKLKTIETVDQKTVHFYDDELVAVRGDDRQIYVSLSHLCSVMGIDRRSQVRRIRQHVVLGEGYYLGDVDTPGGRQQMGLLRVDLVPMWLATLDSGRVGEDIEEKLVRYQKEAAKVLWEAFQEGRLTAAPTLDELLATDSPAAQAYRMAMAIAEMARTQLLFEAHVESRMDNYEERLEQLEARIDEPRRTVSSSQASQISQSVKAVAMQLSKQTGRNEYGGVYGELYRRFEITSYKLLPASRFDEAMTFLNEWYASLTGNAPF
jgi:hypothetical protein